MTMSVNVKFIVIIVTFTLFLVHYILLMRRSRGFVFEDRSLESTSLLSIILGMAVGMMYIGN